MMFPAHAKHLTAICLMVGLMSGCQSIVKTPPPVPQVPSIAAEASTTPVKQFNLEGKIGVKAPQQSGSAFYSWVQDQDQFSIQLNGILGMGKTIIEGQPGQVTLNSNKTGLISASSPEELLERATGWIAPITYLVDWVQAQPATQQAQIERDPQQRLTKINEDGWNVDLNYAENATLPNKLIMRQSLESGEEVRITMLIQKR